MDRRTSQSQLAHGLSLFIVCGLIGCGSATQPPAQPVAAKISVVVHIDFGQESESIEQQLQIDTGGTVADAMRQVDQAEVAITGSGAMTFLDGIDDLRTAGGKGWYFSINDQWSAEGIGKCVLRDGDVIRWTYGEFSSH